MYLCRIFHLISPPLSPILDGQILHVRQAQPWCLCSVSGHHRCVPTGWSQQGLAHASRCFATPRHWTYHIGIYRLIILYIYIYMGYIMLYSYYQPYGKIDPSIVR